MLVDNLEWIVVLAILLIFWVVFEIFAHRRRKRLSRYRDMVKDALSARGRGPVPKRESLVDATIRLSEENDDPGLKLQHKVNDGAWEDTPPYTGELGKPLWSDGGVKHRQQGPTHFTQYEQAYHSAPEPEPDPGFKVHRLKCETCDGPLTVVDGKKLAVCPFCKAQYYLENYDPDLEEFRPPPTLESSPYCLEDPWRYDAGGASTREILGKTGGWLDLEE
jgi:hypothetical protein